MPSIWTTITALRLGRNIAGGMRNLAQKNKQNQATQSVETPKALAAIDAKGTTQTRQQAVAATRSRGTSRNAATATPTTTPAEPVAPTLTKEQQLQLDADAMGLTGVARQAFIEEKRGILPKIRDTKKYNAVTEAEKASGITTSAPVDAGVTDVTTDLTARAEELRNEIASAQANAASDNVGGFEMPNAEDYKKLYDLQQAGADKEFQAALEELKSRYETAAANERQQNSVNAGKMGMSLARSGSLGSISGQSLITNTETANRQRMTELAQEEAQAINNAQLAKDQNDLTRMESYLAKADAIRQERNDIKAKNIDLGFQMEDRAIAEQEREKQAATEQASYYGNLTLDQLNAADPAAIAKVEETLGMPTGYLKSVAETQQALAEAQSDSERMELSLKLFDKAKELPSGQTFTFADGTQITGFDEPEGKVMEMITADGGVAFVTIDPATGEILKTVEVPGMMSELKANAMFRSTGRASGSGGGAVPDGWDGAEVQIAALMRESIGKTTGEVVDMINSLLPEDGQIELDPNNRNAVFTPSTAVGIGSLISTSFSADPTALLDMVEGDYTFRDIEVDGKKTTVAINNNNASNWSAVAQPTENKSSGGGVFGWLKNIFAGGSSVE